MKAADSAAVPMTLANAVELATPVPVATPADTNTVEIAQFKELVETSEQIREMLGALVQNIEPALKFSSWRPAPTKANPTDTCWDLVATSVTHTDKYVEYGTSLRTEIPEGLWGDVRARSSIRNYDLVMCNSTAVIDNPYRGEWKVCFKIVRHVRPGIKGWWDRLRNLFTAPKLYNVGDKIAQVYFPQQGADVIWTRVNTVSMDTERGDGGFGSSDALKSTLGTSNNGTGTSTKASTPTT
jgi:dUTPase